MQFGFTSVCGTTNAIFILKPFLEKYLGKKRNFVLGICRFGESFESGA